MATGSYATTLLSIDPSLGAPSSSPTPSTLSNKGPLRKRRQIPLGEKEEEVKRRRQGSQGSQGSQQSSQQSS